MESPVSAQDRGSYKVKDAAGEAWTTTSEGGGSWKSCGGGGGGPRASGKRFEQRRDWRLEGGGVSTAHSRE